MFGFRSVLVTLRKHMKERTSMENLLEVSDDRKKQSKQKFWKAQIEIVIGAFFIQYLIILLSPRWDYIMDI